MNKPQSPLVQLSPTCLIQLSADSSLLLLSRLSCPDSDSVWSGTRPEGWERKVTSFIFSAFLGLTARRWNVCISTFRCFDPTGGKGRARRAGARGARRVWRHSCSVTSYSFSLKMKVVETKEVVTSDQWIKSPATSDWMTFQGSAALWCWHCEASCLLEDERGFTRSHPSKQQAVEVKYWTCLKLQQVETQKDYYAWLTTAESQSFLGYWKWILFGKIQI